jgi:DnaJ-class molecular chaperone
MKSIQTMYSYLQLDCGASVETIKQSFKRLAKKYHPDLCNGDAQLLKHNNAIMQQLNIAYNILIEHTTKQTNDNHPTTYQYPNTDCTYTYQHANSTRTIQDDASSFGTILNNLRNKNKQLYDTLQKMR